MISFCRWSGRSHMINFAQNGRGQRRLHPSAWHPSVTERLCTLAAPPKGVRNERSRHTSRSIGAGNVGASPDRSTGDNFRNPAGSRENRRATRSADQRSEKCTSTKASWPPRSFDSRSPKLIGLRMGDGTEEQNLNQPSTAGARVKKDEVAAFFEKTAPPES